MQTWVALGPRRRPRRPTSLGLDVSRDERRRGGLGQRERHPPPAGDGRGRRLHGCYARIIFVVVRFKERVLKRSRFKADSLKAGEARGSKKKQHVPGSEKKNTKGKARGNRHLFYDKCIIHVS